MAVNLLDALTMGGILLPVGGSVAGMAYHVVQENKLSARKREAELERQRRLAIPRLPDESAFIATPGLSLEVRGELVGNFLPVGSGTFGRNQLLRLLVLLEQSGLEKLVSAAALLENDAGLRAQFHDRLPACYKDRIVYGYSDAYGGGMGNRAFDVVLDDIETWGEAPDRCANELIDRCLRLNHNRVPGVVLAFLGLGGQAPTALPLLEPVHDRFENSLVLGFVALSEFTDLRERFEVAKPRYEQLAGVFGWILTDDLNANPTTSDVGMIAPIEGLADGALYADQPSAPNNAYTRALPKERGGILIYQTYASSVVGFPFCPDPSIPMRYSVARESVAAEIIRCQRRIDQNKGLWSADLPVGESNRSVFDIVMTSVYHGDLKRIEDRVNRGAILRDKFSPNKRNGTANGKLGPLFGQPNYKRVFGSIATTIDPLKPVCPVVIVRIAAVTNGKNLVPEIVKPPKRRNLPPLQNPPGKTGTNGTNGKNGAQTPQQKTPRGGKKL